MKFPLKFGRSFFLVVSSGFCFLTLYLFLETWPLYKSYFAEEDIFYGNITSVAASRFWNGTNVPIFDKNYFCLNEDRNAVFVLALPLSQREVLGDWFRSWALEGALAPLEIRGKRISKNEWLVTGIEGNDGAMDASVISDFHLRTCLWSFVIDLFCLWITVHTLLRSVRRK